MKKENLFPHHPSYKEVDVIPTSWKKAKLRYVTNVLTDYTANGSFKSLADNVKYLEQGYARLIRLTDLRKNLEVDNPIYVSEEAYNFLKKSALYGEEFLIANVGAYAGFIAPMPKVSFPATLGPNMMLAKFDQSKVNNRFMYYAASSFYIQEQLALKAHSSSAQPKLNKEDFRSIIFIYPEISTQVRIVEYLDQKTSEIDALILDKEKHIELLEEKRQVIITEAVTKGLDSDVKMKDSGVEWIGEIPEHWTTSKIKYLSNHNLIYGANASAELDDENLPRYIRITDIDRNGHLREETFRSLSKDIASKYPLNKGDILFARSGATVGKTYIHQENNNSTYAGYLIKFRSDKNKLNPKFLYYFTKSFCYEKWIEANTIQATIENVSAEKYKNMLIPYPATGEQDAIVEFLESYINDNYTLLKELENQINKLKEYRQSLIYETVTGKIDVQEMLKETDQEEVSSS